MADKSRFCSTCGAEFAEGASFCHHCGSPRKGHASITVTAGPGARRWVAPIAVIVAVAVLSFFSLRARGVVTVAPEQPLAGGAMRPPDISAMTPEERVDRLFNRVMQLWSEGKRDSAAFFAPMALMALQDVRPVTPHVRYDMGLVALVAGNPAAAAAQSDSILAEHSTHLLGLSLAARAADARGDAAAARTFRQRLVAAEQSELARNLPEYSDHNADIRDAISGPSAR